MTDPVSSRRRSTVPRLRAVHPVAPAVVPWASPPRGVVVAIPARDEAAAILACLGSIDRAAARCDLPVRVVVAADRCRDETAELAAAFTGARCELTVVAGRWPSISAARAAAVAVGLGEHRTGRWIASTDADCVVPPDWLTRQLALARGGVHAVAGVVRLGPEASAKLAERFRLHYAVETNLHRHVHAANLGVCVEAYRAVGGWSPHSALGEEHHLWRRLRRRRLETLHDADLWVYTSHRTEIRVVGGFASRLRQLLVESPHEPATAS